MTQYDLQRLISDAKDCDNLEQYIVEEGGALPAEFYRADGNAENALRLLRLVWQLSEDFSYKTIRRLSGKTQRAFSVEHDIPLRTIEQWETALRTPPHYVLELLAVDVINDVFADNWSYAGGQTD